MNKFLMSAAIAGVVAATASIASAEDAANAGKEKCFGIAKAGKNSCAAADGAHSCAGQAKADNLPAEWVFVATGECVKAGGKLEAPKAN